MSSDRLKLNADKTHFIWLGTRQQLDKKNCSTITLVENIINQSDDVTVLEVVFDPEMTFRTHIKRLTGKRFYQLRQLRTVRGVLTLDASKAVVHAFVSSRVDYCNGVLSIVRAKHLGPLQSVLNAAHRVVSRRRKYDHISDFVRDQVHWLPIAKRIEYKLCIFVYKCLHQLAPQYLVEICKVVSDLPGHINLRCASRGALIELRTKTSTDWPRSFVVCTWNRLTSNLRDHSLSVGQLSCFLKTELFRRAY